MDHSSMDHGEHQICCGIIETFSGEPRRSLRFSIIFDISSCI